MSRIIIHIPIGKVFHWLTVLENNHTQNNRPAALCQCKCGEVIVVRKTKLVSKNTRSCGCQTGVIHGLSGSATYSSWSHMKGRCLNPDNDSYKSYGGRGIKIDSRWLNFENFVSDMGLRPEGMELDRILVNGDYTKNNCRWLPRSVKSDTQRNKDLMSVLKAASVEDLQKVRKYLKVKAKEELMP